MADPHMPRRGEPEAMDDAAEAAAYAEADFAAVNQASVQRLRQGFLGCFSLSFRSARSQPSRTSSVR